MKNERVLRYIDTEIIKNIDQGNKIKKEYTEDIADLIIQSLMIATHRFYIK